MNNLFEKWKGAIPKYSEEFRAPLFDLLSRKGGGSERGKVDRGKQFANNYELYMYAFFYGLYQNEFVPIPAKTKKVDFNHAIQFWGSKSNFIGRKDFTVLQEYIFAALIAKTEIDILALEKGEMTEEEAVRKLVETMEGYTNGGLQLIKEKFDENSNLFLQSTAFLNLIMGKKGK